MTENHKRIYICYEINMFDKLLFVHGTSFIEIALACMFDVKQCLDICVRIDIPMSNRAGDHNILKYYMT